MFYHKKFKAALVASLIVLLGGYSTGLAESSDFVAALVHVDWTGVIVPWLVAIGAQGIADHGKEKAIIEGMELEGLLTDD